MPERAHAVTVEKAPHGPTRRDPAMPNDSRPRRLPRLRRLLVLATDNWPARGYLAVFAGTVPIAFVFPDSVYAMIPMMLTEPLSFLGVVLPVGPGVEGDGPLVVLASVVTCAWLLLCALVNAAALGALSHHVRDRRTARHA